MRRAGLFSIFLQLAWLAGALAPAGLLAIEPFSDYFSGMRLRGLHRLAEQYGLSRLVESQLNSAERSLVAVELSRTFAAHALSEGGADEDELWARAGEVLRSPLAEGAETNPRWVEAVLQQATLPVERGLGLTWRHLLFPDDSGIREQAEAVLRKGIRELTAARRQLDEAIKGDRPLASRIAQGALSPAEFRRLNERSAYQLAVAHVELGRVLPPGTERTNTLREALKQLEPLSKARTSTAFEANLQRIVANRLLGDLALATTLLNDLANDELADFDRDRVLAEQVRVLVRQGQLPDAIARVVEARKTRVDLNDEARASLIDAYLAAWSMARDRKDTALAEDLWKQLQTEVATIRGGWRTYADLRVEQAGDVARYGEALANRIRTARLAYQAGEIDRSIAEFGDAIGEAMERKLPEVAIELASTRASILLKAERFEEAATAFGQIVERFPDNPQSPDAGLLGAYSLARLSEREPTSARRDAAIEALTRQIESYPNHPTAIEARWMLALVFERQRRWTEAIGLYEAIPSDSPHGGELAGRLAAVHVERWREARRTGQITPALEDEAGKALGTLVAGFPGPPAGWSTAQADIGLKLALVDLLRQEPRSGPADEVLGRIGESVELARRESRRDERPLDPEWGRVERQVQQLRILALAHRGEFEEARRVLESLNGTSPAERLGVLAGLSDFAQDLPEGPRRELGRLQLQAARPLQARRQDLEPAAREQLDRCLAQAFAATGNIPEAVTLYESLLSEGPPDKALMRTIAGLLAERGQSNDLEKAGGWLQKLESLEKKGSPEWIAARLAVGENLLSRGKASECLRLLRATRILYPQLGGEETKSRFEDLERRAAAPSR